jgi:hypothetical protein
VGFGQGKQETNIKFAPQDQCKTLIEGKKFNHNNAKSDKPEELVSSFRSLS